MTLTRGSDGVTLSTYSVKLDPCELYFAEKKSEPEKTSQDTYSLSVNVGKRNLYLITVSVQCLNELYRQLACSVSEQA